jgi:hypothetical protein
MSKIFRRILNKDSDGDTLSRRTEKLIDDGAGTIKETYETSVTRCPACRRPLEKVSEMRGRCVVCSRYCCSLCAGSCSACGRGPLCGRCRTGFPEKNLSVCADCLHVLRRRLEHQDRLLTKKVAFEQTLALYQTQLRFLQLLQQDKGRISETIAGLARLRVARKIARLEKKLQQEHDDGKPLLP